MLSLQHRVVFGIRQGTLQHGKYRLRHNAQHWHQKAVLVFYWHSVVMTLDTTFMGW